MINNLSDKYNKLLIKNNLLYLVSNIISVAIQLISLILFTQTLAPSDYGTYALAIIYATFIAGIANLGITSAFERNFFKYKDDPVKLSELFYSCILFIIFNFLLLYSISYLFREKLSTFLTGSEQNDLIILLTLLGYFLFNTALNINFTYLKNIRNAREYVLFKVISALLYFIFSFIFIKKIQIGVIGLAWSQTITGTIIFLSMNYNISKKWKISFNKNILLESIKLSLPMTPRVFIGVLNNHFDKYMINIFQSTYSVGIFHISRIISYTVFSFMTSLENVFSPEVYNKMFGDDKDKRRDIGDFLIPFLYFSMAIAFFASIFSEEFIKILLPKNYHDTVPVVSILCMNFGFMFFGKIIPIQFIFTKNTRFISYFTFFGVTLNILLNIPLIYAYGAVGAAIATFISNVINNSIGFIVAQKYYKILYNWNKIIMIFVISTSSFILIFILRNYGISSTFLLFMKFMTSFFYLMIGYRYGYFSKKNIDIILSLIKK